VLCCRRERFEPRALVTVLLNCVPCSPRYDWFQTDSTVNVVVYTKRKVNPLHLMLLVVVVYPSGSFAFAIVSSWQHELNEKMMNDLSRVFTIVLSQPNTC